MLEAALYDTLRQRLDARRRERRVDRPVLSIGAAIVVTGLTVSLAGPTWFGLREKPAPGPMRVTIGAQTFTIPPHWLQGRPAPRGGRLMVVVPWSDITRAPEASEPADIVLTLAPADGSMAPAERPSLLYARFLTPATAAAEGGLVRREFREGSPFEGEALYLSPPQGRAFAARCPASPQEGPGRTRCLAEFRVGDVDLVAAFEPALLPQWDLLAKGIRRIAERRGGG